MTPLRVLPADHKAKLIVDIARKLDASESDVRVYCESLREVVRGLFEDEIGPTKKRDRLLKIAATCREAAIAIAGISEGGDPETLADTDWLAGRKFTFKDREVSVTSTELLLWLGEAIQAAEMAAEKLVLPKARSTPEKDVTAFFACALIFEFANRQGPNSSKRAKRLEPERPRPYGAYAIEGNWSRLSPEFREAHNRWRQTRTLVRDRYPSSLVKHLVVTGKLTLPALYRSERELAPIPLPQTDHYVRPPRRRREYEELSTAPGGLLLSIVELLFEYFMGHSPDEGLERSCRKMRRTFFTFYRPASG
jgi:hypothetical protein